MKNEVSVNQSSTYKKKVEWKTKTEKPATTATVYTECTHTHSLT